MKLSSIRDYIASLDLADQVYQGKMPDKQDRVIGVYNSKHEHAYKTAIGGTALESYGLKYVTFLVHWNKSPRDTEEAAQALFSALQQTDNVTVNNETIKYIQLMVNEPVDVGTDDAGIFEMVIEAAVVYEKGE